MSKRGQVAVFFIIGLVIVILVALMFVGRKELGIGISKESFLTDQAEPLKENILKCVDQSLNENARTFLLQGGDFEPSRYVLYESKKVKYLCYNIQGKDQCINMMPSFTLFMEKISNKVNDDVNNCIDKDLFKSGLAYDIEVNGEPKTELQLIGETVKVVVNYDVKLMKGDVVQDLGKVEKNINIPFKELYDVTSDVINNQASTGFFEQLFYMLQKKGAYEINVDKSPSLGNVGDIIYKINKKDNDYQLWFAVEGE